MTDKEIEEIAREFLNQKQYSTIDEFIKNKYPACSDADKEKIKAKVEYLQKQIGEPTSQNKRSVPSKSDYYGR